MHIVLAELFEQQAELPVITLFHALFPSSSSLLCRASTKPKSHNVLKGIGNMRYLHTIPRIWIFERVTNRS